MERGTEIDRQIEIIERDTDRERKKTTNVKEKLRTVSARLGARKREKEGKKEKQRKKPRTNER